MFRLPRSPSQATVNNAATDQPATAGKCLVQPRRAGFRVGCHASVSPFRWLAQFSSVLSIEALDQKASRAGAEEASIWYHCVLRGDTNIIRIGPRTNIQDGTIIHVNAGRQSTIFGADVTVGHAAIIHACRLEDRAFVGMGATVLDDAVIEAGGVLAAGSVLPPGKRIAALELWMGNPAKLVRVLTPEARAGFDRTAPHYVELADRHRGIS
jgi:carbonic anhydrase/acetyltransferase-like protein (isoleucine patch superfamily)